MTQGDSAARLDGPVAVSANMGVLLAIVRGIARAETDPRLGAALQRVADWDALIDLALEHGLVAQMHAALKAAPEPVAAVVPSVAHGRLTSLAGANATRSLRMTRQLLIVIERLEQAGVPALALKGPAISRLAYGDESLRSFADVDVLVVPADALKALAVLEASGLVTEGAWNDISWSRIEAAEQEIVLKHPTTSIIVELHWRIGPRFARDSLLADELFARAGRVDLLGRQIPTLGLPDSVLALTVHASTHEWCRLEDVAALCGLLRRFTDGEWRTLASLAAEHRCRRRLAVGLRLARNIGGLATPWQQGSLADFPGARRLAEEVQALLVGPEAKRLPATRFSRGLEVLWQARVLDSRGACLRHLWRRLLTPGARDWALTGRAAFAWLPGVLGRLVARQARLWRR